MGNIRVLYSLSRHLLCKGRLDAFVKDAVICLVDDHQVTAASPCCTWDCAKYTESAVHASWPVSRHFTLSTRNESVAICIANKAVSEVMVERWVKCSGKRYS